MNQYDRIDDHSFFFEKEVKPNFLRDLILRHLSFLAGTAMIGLALALSLILASWSVHDPSFNYVTDNSVQNILGYRGAIIADLLMQTFGLASAVLVILPAIWGWRLVRAAPSKVSPRRAGLLLIVPALFAGALSVIPAGLSWPLPFGLGGLTGDLLVKIPRLASDGILGLNSALFEFTFFILPAIICFFMAARAFSAPRETIGEEETDEDQEDEEWVDDVADEHALAPPVNISVRRGWSSHILYSLSNRIITPLMALIGHICHIFFFLQTCWRRLTNLLTSFRNKAPRKNRSRREFGNDAFERNSGAAAPGDDILQSEEFSEENIDGIFPSGEKSGGPPANLDIWLGEDGAGGRVVAPSSHLRPGKRAIQEAQRSLALKSTGYQLPPLRYLRAPSDDSAAEQINADALEQNARILESVLEDFGVRGEIIAVRPGPVVTLYELEPAPGIKSSRVIGLADDIARSMSAVSARVAVIPGKNAIGIELPNHSRETVYLRELLAADDFERSKARLALALGKTIGGEPVIVDLAKMPHLLVAGTTGSGKSVSINTMLLSLLYRRKPDQCKLIMIDPKMLELSNYDGIPHLLTPVVTDPKKAVVALKWTVREMENRYRLMSKLGVRNIDGYNLRVRQAIAKGETFKRTVQTGFDPASGEPMHETEDLPCKAFPYIVVIVDEMADLMLVAGKEIEGAIQRLAQMARAAGIHLIMATQRPSVDVITGTIKANFPTRISFQVTSKIDSRTILGEQGAEHLLGQGDMLYMAGGGRICRVHGPLVADEEIDRIVEHLKAQGAPEYLAEITENFEDTASEISDAAPSENQELYDQAVAIILRDRKASTSYIQRRLSVGYNRAASLIERMEEEGVISPANHAGKREVLVPQQSSAY